MNRPASQFQVWTSMLWLASALFFGWLWFHSYWQTNTLLVFVPADRMQAVTSVDGRVEFLFSDVSAGPQWEWSLDTVNIDSSVYFYFAPPAPSRDQHVGLVPQAIIAVNPNAIKANQFNFGLKMLQGSEVRIPDTRAIILTIPHWLVILACLIIPSRTGLVIYRSLGRSQRGLCPVCGYDLRASPQRCPECGTSTSQEHVESISKLNEPMARV